MTIQIYELCGANPERLFSPHCWKVRMAVAHKGLEWETIPTPFTKVATIEGGDARRIPVIRDGDTVVEESYQIARYLGGRPVDREQRQRIAAVAIDDVVSAATTQLVIAVT